MATLRLTMAQALIRFLKRQVVERDGRREPLYTSCLGIFGHGIVAGLGEALQENPDLRYYQVRNEQSAVHIAAAFGRMSNRLRTLTCASSIGPGATNMVTGAAGATINRIPVLLLPGDIFSRRNVAPVLQQLEQPWSEDISVNDCLKPVSRCWDRINRAEQLITALPEAMRVLTSHAEAGAVTLALPQDVQAEAYDYPAELFEERVSTVPRPRADLAALRRAAEWSHASRASLMIAGGGVLYSEASEALRAFAERTGIPVAETQAGKGALPYNHPLALGAVGVTGTPGANITAREADLVIGICTRYTDFTTASQTAFRNAGVRFLNVNVCDFDAYKQGAAPLTGDARAVLEELAAAAEGYHTDGAYEARAARFNAEWDAEVARIYALGHGSSLSQGEVIGAVNDASGPRAVVVCAAGSLQGDPHKLWRTRDPKGYHLEYGYSCMGYEIAGGIGIRMADPTREVYAMVGDGSSLMMPAEIMTAVQEGVKLSIVLIDNHGFAPIGGLSESAGSQGFGTHFHYRDPASGELAGAPLPVDYAANVRSLGADVLEARDQASLRAALVEARGRRRTTVIVVETDPELRVPGYESWWDLPVAEVSEIESVRQARAAYEEALKKERCYMGPGTR